MADLKTKIEVELECIDQVLAEIPSYDQLPELSILELAGVATFLHNFYNGIENIIKQIITSKNITIPTGSSWHKNLIDIATTNNIISKETKESLGEYLAFRHFFSHLMHWIFIQIVWNH